MKLISEIDIQKPIRKSSHFNILYSRSDFSFLCKYHSKGHKMKNYSKNFTNNIFNTLP